MWAGMNSAADDCRLIQSLIAYYDTNAAQVAKKIGVANTTINRFKAGTASTRLGRDTLEKLRAAYPDFPDFVVDADYPAAPPAGQDYVPVEILPTFAGMGGGGTGDGDQEFGLVPRRLIEDELRAKPSDFLLIDTRGDSMAPDFIHGDQILIDKRDVNPVQPGYFALWDGDGYVLKNVERVNGGLRVFATNGKYQERIVDPTDIQIMGRPVWFARRL